MADTTKQLGNDAGNHSQAPCKTQLSSVTFPSIKEDVFRVSLTPDDIDGGVVIWMESKASKAQWQLSVKDVAHHGPSGIPFHVLLHFLKTALESCSTPTNPAQTADNVPSAPSSNADQYTKPTEPADVDMVIANGGKATLTLTTHVGSVWSLCHTFELEPLALDPVDVVKAQLRDAQEEIRGLKRSLHIAEEAAKKPKISPYLTVTSSSTCAGVRTRVTWDMQGASVSDKAHFEASKDATVIKVKKPGVYQMSAQVALSHKSQSNASLSVYVNNTLTQSLLKTAEQIVDPDVQHNCFGTPKPYACSLQLTDILTLKEDAEVFLVLDGLGVTNMIKYPCLKLVLLSELGADA